MDSIEGGREPEVDAVQAGDLEVLVNTPPSAGAQPASAVLDAADRRRYTTSPALTRPPTTREAF